MPLDRYTTWAIGGPARLLAEPESLEEWRELVGVAREEGIPMLVLGRGSNVLVDDAGFDGLVICLRRCLLGASPDLESGTIRAEAGCPMPTLAAVAEKAQVDRFDFLVGIPGTVGAGVAINAGFSQREVSSVLLRATLFDPATDGVWTEDAASLELGYRTSNVPKRRLWVISAEFDASERAPLAELQARRRAHLAHRSGKQPLNKKTCGSVFKSAPGGHAAGWYIDQAGLKGHRIGGAAVSEKHGNWIENLGDATSGDVKDLIRDLTEQVHARFGVTLEREVIYLPEERS